MSFPLTLAELFIDWAPEKMIVFDPYLDFKLDVSEGSGGIISMFFSISKPFDADARCKMQDARDQGERNASKQCCYAN